MRIWSLHPQYLDSKGLVALWRETLLAQNVLADRTNGYKNHPQLDRFKAQKDPLAAIGNYLEAVAEEASARGYRFDRTKILKTTTPFTIPVTDGQLSYEFNHLKNKLNERDQKKLAAITEVTTPKTHPLFVTTPGDVEKWERV
jgi:hypothetical protein